MVDGRNGIGHHVATETARAVSAAARQFGVAIALVHNSNHFGFAGYYATLIGQWGQISIVTSNGQVCVAPAGATEAMLSNDPLAIAAPTGRDDTFLEMDLATSVTSRANVVEAAKSSASAAVRLRRRMRKRSRHARSEPRRSPVACWHLAAAKRASPCWSPSRRSPACLPAAPMPTRSPPRKLRRTRRKEQRTP